MKKVILLLVIYFYNISCCYIDPLKRRTCNSPIEVSAEATEDWKDLLLYSFKKTITLKKDAFKRAPILTLLSLATIKTIEVGALNGLHKLDKLVIYDSDLDEVPEGILENLPIRSLQIYQKIHKVSASLFKNLPNLREVDLRNNTLGEIKAGVFNNTPIDVLYLDWDEINEIEKGAFINMGAMYLLSLTGNNLKSFDSVSILGDNALERLWLDKNQLTRITKTMFCNLQSLQKLYLGINQIESIENGAFNNLPNLVSLDLSNNKIKEIQPQIFPKQGSKLYYFFLHNNKFTFINNAVFARSPELRYISYGGNPFQCPCLDEVKDWTARHNITRLCDDLYFSGDRPGCVFSEIDKNKCIYDVDLNDNLTEVYEHALEDYPKLNLKCDTTRGINKAVLNP